MSRGAAPREAAPARRRVTRRRLLAGAAGAAAAAVTGLAITTPVPEERVRRPGGSARGPAGEPQDRGRLVWGADPQRQAGWLAVPDPASWGGGERRPVYPVVVMIHGGSWSDASDPGYMSDLAWDLARHGVAVWAPTYRGLPDRGGWPETFLDISDAIDYVPRLEEPGRFVPDLDRVHLLGHSAGAHLAAWAAGRDRLPDGAPGSDGTVIAGGATCMAGVYDLSRAEEADGGGLVRDLLGGVGPQERPGRYALASPIEQLPLERPIDVLHGERDEVVPVSSLETYLARHRETGNRGAVEILEGVGHDDWADVRGEPWATARRACLAQLTP